MAELHPAARELVDALVAADDKRPRTQQLGPGFSSLGACRRRVSHEIRKDPKCNRNVKRLPSILGTGIHKIVEELGLPGRAEEPLVLEEIGLPGTADRIHDGYLDDFKTTSMKNIDWVREHGPGRQKRWQVHSYAMAWNAATVSTNVAVRRIGAPVHTVRLIFIPRDGTEDDILVWEEPYDEEVALEAIDWFQEIRDAVQAGETVPPEKDPSFCVDWCPFYGRLCQGRVPEEGADAAPVSDDPWLEEAARAYAEAADMEKRAKARKAQARDALEGFGGRVPGYRVSWVHREGNLVPDREAIELALGEVPMRRGRGSDYPLVKPEATS